MTSSERTWSSLGNALPRALRARFQSLADTLDVEHLGRRASIHRLQFSPNISIVLNHTRTGFLARNEKQLHFAFTEILHGPRVIRTTSLHLTPSPMVCSLNVLPYSFLVPHRSLDASDDSGTASAKSEATSSTRVSEQSPATQSGHRVITWSS
jgi:hypothetical protein